jgi:8-oxo-dGTP diphosphatase
MPALDQGVNYDRYMVVPRTLIFLRRDDKVLLLRGAPNKRLWAGLYNGIGGHVELGESIPSAAQREIWEETGLSVDDLLLCGIVTVDTQENPGVCIFLFTGESHTGEPKISPEGSVEWVSPLEIANLPCIPDLPVLLPKVLDHQPTSPPFIAHTRYDENRNMVIKFF